MLVDKSKTASLLKTVKPMTTETGNPVSAATATATAAPVVELLPTATVPSLKMLSHKGLYGTLPRDQKMPKKLSYSVLEPYGTIWNHMETFLEVKRGIKN